jgi:choline monooxygenase
MSALVIGADKSKQAQLPVYAYFDQDFYAQEQQYLFKVGPQYVGHELMIPQVGDYQVLMDQKRQQLLKRTEQGVVLLSNVCRHRQALMLQGRGNSMHITCPLHRWTYDNYGVLKGAPHFSDTPCLALPQTPLTQWNGMLFEAGRHIAVDLQNLSIAPMLNFSGYLFDRAEVTEYDCNWKTFIEVYLEDYHVDAFHPGLGHFVNCAELKWEFSDWYSVQTVGLQGALERAGSAVYQRWHQEIKNFYQGSLPKHGAIWMVYFPNIMIEWYPQALIISTVIPDGPQKTRNVVEYYYPEEVLWFEPDLIAAQQAAYHETAVEDREICLRMEAGRRALYEAGENQVGPYQSPMEDGMRHFHQFIRRIMAGRM